MVGRIKTIGLMTLGFVSIGMSERAIAAQDRSGGQVIRGAEISLRDNSFVYRGWASYYTKNDNHYVDYNKPNDHTSIMSETNYRFNENVPMAAIPLWMLYDLGIHSIAYLDELEVVSLKTGKKIRVIVMDTGGLLGERCKNVTRRDPTGQCGRIIDLNKTSMRLLGHSPEQEGIIPVEIRVIKRTCDPPKNNNKLPNCKIDPKRAGELIAQAERANRLGTDSNIAQKSVDLLVKPLENNELLTSLGNSVKTPIEVGLGLKEPKTEREAWALNVESLEERRAYHAEKLPEVKKAINRNNGSILERLRDSRDTTLEIARAVDNYQLYQIQAYQGINQRVEQQNYITEKNLHKHSSSTISKLLMSR